MGTRTRQTDFVPVPITAAHAKHVEHLPWHHRDPFDRMLIAQAAFDGRMLVSADGVLATCGGPVLW